LQGEKINDKMFKMNKSFTLIEILVVIVIIGILSAFIIVSMAGVSDKATIAKGQAFSSSLKNSLLLDLVSEWKLNGDSTDSWGSNNGTWSGPLAPNATANYWSASECISGQCLHFDGVDDVVNCGNNSSLSMGTRDHTISIWARFDNASPPTEEETLIFCGGTVAPSDGYWIRRQIGGTGLYFCFNDGSETRLNGLLSANGTLVANNWYNIVVRMDRDASAQAFINGQIQIGYTVGLSSRQGDVQNTYNLQIGGYGASYTMAGKIDDVKIYHAVASSSQIQENNYSGLNKLFAHNEFSAREYQQRLGELKLNLANHE